MEARLLLVAVGAQTAPEELVLARAALFHKSQRQVGPLSLNEEEERKRLKVSQRKNEQMEPGSGDTRGRRSQRPRRTWDTPLCPTWKSEPGRAETQRGYNTALRAQQHAPSIAPVLFVPPSHSYRQYNKIENLSK